MDVVLFGNVVGEDRPSMERYPDELLKHMPKNVSGFAITARRLPFVRHYLHKELLYPIVARRSQGDINHITDHSYAGLLRALDPKKTLVTCHDLIPLENPAETSLLGGQRYWFNVKQLPRAAKIIAISQHTKDSVMRFFDVPEDRIRVVHYGVSEKFRVMDGKEELKRKHGLGGKTLLHVGSSFPRKNVELILDVLKTKEDLTLLKVGGFSEKQKKFIRKNKLSGRVMQLGVIRDDEKLAELYNAADALFMPSLHEGFGLPVLEAMACGCPVVCSDIPVFRELFEGAVVFTPPNDVDKAAGTAGRVLDDKAFRSRLVESGLERSKKFSWIKCARETYRVYEEVYGGRKD